MLFNSIPFLGFLIVVVTLYYLFPHRYRWTLLLGASIYFYTSWDMRLEPLLLLVLATIGTYACGLAIKRADGSMNKSMLILGLFINMGMLALYKLGDFVIQQVNSVAGLSIIQPEFLLPVGLSFYTFSAVTYLVDIYRGKVEPERHLGRVALYIAFFPKIFAGPIERARNFLPNIKKKISLSPENITVGSRLILWGLFKKVVIADRLAPMVKEAFTDPQYTPPLVLLLGVYYFAFQIYLDFSAYSDIARGATRLLGFNLMGNFKQPYLSTRVSEFWNSRWHISLGTWFKEYLYIPMGGNRVNIVRYYFNLMFVFIVSGIWHAGIGFGVNYTFPIWGAINGLYIWGEVSLNPVWERFKNAVPGFANSLFMKIVSVLFTFHLILITWVFFRANSVGDALTIFNRLYSNIENLPRMVRIFSFQTDHYLSFILIAFVMIIEIFQQKVSFWDWLNERAIFWRWGFYYALIVALLLLGQWGFGEFIYMQF
ncbi:MAG: MBOAT family O-acyltransferase [Bacillota bacterium]